MTVGIDIDVDTGKVDKAKKAVLDLNREVATTGKGTNIPVDTTAIQKARKDILTVKEALEQVDKYSDLQLDMNGATEIQESLVAMSDTMRRLQGLSAQGSRQGGKLDAAQRREAQRLEREQITNAAAYEKALAKIGTNLDALYAKKRRLQSTKLSNPEEWTKAQEEIKAVEAEVAAQTKAYEKTQERFDPRHDKFKKRSDKAIDELRGYSDTPEQPEQDGGGTSARGIMRKTGKILGYAGALLGGMSIMQLISQSMSKAGTYSAMHADLTALGGSEWRDKAALLGYTPDESASIATALTSKTGYQKEELSRGSVAAAAFGRDTGIGGQTVANYMAGSFAATGANPKEYHEHLKMLRDSAIALGARGRIEEVLRNNQQLMTTMVARNGGTELTDQERIGVLAMQMGLWGTKGQGGKGDAGTNTLGKIDQAIRGGGSTPGAQAFIATALGVNDIKDLKGLWKFESRMAKGLKDPENMRDIIALSKKQSEMQGLSKEDAAEWHKRNIKAVLEISNDETDRILSDSFLNSINDPETAIKKVAGTKKGKSRLGEYQHDKGLVHKLNAHRRTLAGMDNAEVNMGGHLLPFVDKFKDGFVRMEAALEKGDLLGAVKGFTEDNPIGQILAVATGLTLGGKFMPDVNLPGLPKKGPGAVPVPPPVTPKGPMPGAKLLGTALKAGAFLQSSAPGDVEGPAADRIVFAINQDGRQATIDQAKRIGQGDQQDKGGPSAFLSDPFGIVTVLSRLTDVLEDFNKMMHAMQGHTPETYGLETRKPQ